MPNLKYVDTGLSVKYIDILNSVIGQLSDGIWENSPRMNKYWKNASISAENGNVYIVVNDNWASGFKGMDDTAIKMWFANKIKAIIKEEGLEWSRGNKEVSDFISRQTDITVSDCYYAYEVLKGRNVAKHHEYSIKEACEILNRAGYLVEKL